MLQERRDIVNFEPQVCTWLCYFQHLPRLRWECPWSLGETSLAHVAGLQWTRQSGTAEAIAACGGHVL